MKSKAYFLLTLVLLSAACYAQITPVEKLYLGQKPPGSKAEIFAPGIISLENRFESYPAFSPDGTEMYFTVVNETWTKGKILFTKLSKGVWSTPITAPFSMGNYINWECAFSPDGKLLLFSSSRPPSSSSNMDIWMTERLSDTAWTEPVRLNSPVNSNSDDGTPSISANETLYFKSRRGGGVGGSWLYRAKLNKEANYQVENLGNVIKTGPMETEPFISPDEKYLIFTSQTRKGGAGGWDLWICFRSEDNSWTEPINMGAELNSADDEYGPRVSYDGKYLFFTREIRGKSMDIYWVDTGIIEKLKGLHKNEK